MAKPARSSAGTLAEHFVMADASTHFVSESIDYKLFNALGTRAGGESVSFP
jgi:hypothetical protein